MSEGNQLGLPSNFGKGAKGKVNDVNGTAEIINDTCANCGAGVEKEQRICKDCGHDLVRIEN